MKFSKDYRRLAAYDEENTPEQEEEFLSRDWPEASRPLQGPKALKWTGPDKGNVHWSTSGGGRDRGPQWQGRGSYGVSEILYAIWAERNFHEDWRGDFYTYAFDCLYKIIPGATKGKKKTPAMELKYIELCDTLQEAQKVCEDHYRKEYGE